MSINNQVEDFLAPMRSCAGKNQTVSRLIEMIEKNGRAVSLVRSLPTFPKMSADEYETRRLEAIKKAAILSGEEDQTASEELPEKYEDFLLLVKKHAQYDLPIFTAVFPEDWNKKKDIGLCQVEKAAQDYFLPGMNLAGYSTQISVKPEGVEILGDVIFYSSIETHSFYTGLARIHACRIVQLSRLIPDDTNLALFPREFIDWMFHGKERKADDLKLVFQIEADRIVSEIINERVDNLLLPILETFFPLGQMVHFPKLQKSMRESAEFIKKELRIPEGKTELERTASDVMIMRSILVNVLPVEKAIEFFKAAGLARPQPYMLKKD